MFNEEQIKSFQNIKAPAGLRERVVHATLESKKSSFFSYKKALLSFAPVAACLILCVSLFSFNGKNHNTPLTLFAEGQSISSEEMFLSPMTEPAVSLVRTASLEPRTYSLELSSKQDMEVLSGDGSYTCPDKTHVNWNISVPMEDTIYSMEISRGKDIYLVHLSYHAATDTFSIYYETK